MFKRDIDRLQALVKLAENTGKLFKLVNTPERIERISILLAKKLSKMNKES